MRMRKIPSEMELAPRYKLLIHCLHYLHCLQCLHCTPLNCLSCLHFFSLFLLSDSGQMPGRLNLPSNCPAGKQNNQQSILTILKTAYFAIETKLHDGGLCLIPNLNLLIFWDAAYSATWARLQDKWIIYSPFLPIALCNNFLAHKARSFGLQLASAGTVLIPHTLE